MDDHRDDSQVREFRLEGVGLFVIGGLFLVALACAFYLGRWVERRSSGPEAGPRLTDGAPAGSSRSERPVDVGEESGAFDTLGGEVEAEPERQAIELPSPAPEVVEGSAAVRAKGPEKPAPLPERSSPPKGPFYVQLFAGRDKASAEGLARGLGDRGYRVRLDTERAGDGILYRVRVGGYEAKPDAEVLAERLRNEGYSDAWVTRVD
jgi:cell division septation protein DedD